MKIGLAVPQRGVDPTSSNLNQIAMAYHIPPVFLIDEGIRPDIATAPRVVQEAI